MACTSVLVGAFLATVFLGLLILQQAIQARWMPRGGEPLPEELLTLFNGIANNPVLLAVWLGPVAWLGVATFEELIRVFMLNRLWTIWPSVGARWTVIAISSILFGVAHLYQGPASVIAISIQGFLYAWYYKRFGRVWPMIIGHALYDSVQVVQVVAAFRGG